MTRRDLLLHALPVFAFAGQLRAASSKTVSVGAQTNAWKIDTEDFSSLTAVLDRIAKLGYEGFETSYRNIQPVFGRLKQGRTDLAGTGLKFFGCHIAMSDYDAKSNIPPSELIEKIATNAAALGAERLILSGSPVADEGGPMDDQRLLWKAGALNRAGRACEGLKLRVCYHNHGPEFASGGAEIQALMRETDPNNIRFVINGGHALRAKTDLPAFFAKYHKRIDGIHLMGLNEFQYDSLAAAIRKARWTGWLIAEEEGEKGDSAMGPAREQIRKLFGV